MLKDVTFGQYYPGNSLLHRTDPRIKMLIMIEYLVFVIVANSELAAAVSLMFTAFLIAVSGVRFRILIKSVKPLVFILIFTALINLFFTKGESEPLVAWKFINIYKEDAIERKMLPGNYNCKYFFKLHSFMCLKVSCLYI